MPGAKKEALVLATGLPDGSPDAKTKADPGTNARLEFQLPRYHFACRKTGRSTAARMDRRAYPVNGGGPAAITRRLHLSPRLLTGDGLPVPCCRFAPANGSLKAVIRGSRVLLKAFDEMLGV